MSTSPQPVQTTDVERVPLARLARTNDNSPALLRVVAAGTVRCGPGRVAVAAFNSSV